MKFLLVGGAVRDELLGRDRSDRDWLILGADHDALLSHGFRAVGQHFTVYLHPDTHEEYALPRGPEAPSDEGAQSALIGDLERREALGVLRVDVGTELCEKLHGLHVSVLR